MSNRLVFDKDGRVHLVGTHPTTGHAFERKVKLAQLVGVKLQTKGQFADFADAIEFEAKPGNKALVKSNDPAFRDHGPILVELGHDSTSFIAVRGDLKVIAEKLGITL